MRIFGVIVSSVALLFGSVSTNVTSTICTPLATPTITAPANKSKTRQSQVKVSGSASAGSKVTIKVDSSPKLRLTADTNDYYAGIVTLTNGTHTIIVTASTPCESRDSTAVTVTVSTPKPPTTPPKQPPQTPTTPPSPSGGGSFISPYRYQDQPSAVNNQPSSRATKEGIELTVNGIRDGATTTDPAVEVWGSISKPGIIKIYVNGTLVASTLEAASDYRLTIPLEEGTNRIKVVGTVGNVVVEKELTVYRQVAASQPEQGWWSWDKLLLLLLGLLLVSILWWFIIAWRRRKKEKENEEDSSYGQTF